MGIIYTTFSILVKTLKNTFNRLSYNMNILNVRTVIYIEKRKSPSILKKMLSMPWTSAIEAFRGYTDAALVANKVEYNTFKIVLCPLNLNNEHCFETNNFNP